MANARVPSLTTDTDLAEPQQSWARHDEQRTNHPRPCVLRNENSRTKHDESQRPPSSQLPASVTQDIVPCASRPSTNTSRIDPRVIGISHVPFLDTQHQSGPVPSAVETIHVDRDPSEIHRDSATTRIQLTRTNGESPRRPSEPRVRGSSALSTYDL